MRERKRLSEQMESMGYLQKPLDLAVSSQRSVENLLIAEAEVLKVYVSITNLFSSFFVVLENAVAIIPSLGRTGYIFGLSHFDVPLVPEASTRPTQVEETSGPPINAKPLGPFTLNLAIARKMASDLAAKPLNNPSKSLLTSPSRTMLSSRDGVNQTGASNILAAQEDTLLCRVAELQTAIESKINPTLQRMSFITEAYEKKVLSQNLAGAQTTIPLYPRNQIEEKTTAQPKEGTSPISPDTFNAVSYASGLPVLISSLQMPSVKLTSTLSQILPKQPQDLATVPNITSIHSTETESKTLESSTQTSPSAKETSDENNTVHSDHTRPTVPQIHVNLMLTEIGLSMASWMKAQEDALKKSETKFYSIPIAASTAEQFIYKNYSQPVSIKETSHRSASSVPDSNEVNSEKVVAIVPAVASFGLGLAAASGKVMFQAGRSIGKLVSVAREKLTLQPIVEKFEAVTESAKLEDQEFGLASSVSNIARPFYYSQSVWRDVLLAGHSLYSNTSAENLMSQAEMGSQLNNPSTEVEELKSRKLRSFHGMPAVLALVGAGNLIVQRMQTEMAAFEKETRGATLAYAESFAELSSVDSFVNPTVGEPVTLSSASFTEPYITPASKVKPRSLAPIVPANPAIHDTINLSVSVDSTEEDLRDLERKINRILSEQLSRYYGSPRI
jgi:hypothetical protein